MRTVVAALLIVSSAVPALARKAPAYATLALVQAQCNRTPPAPPTPCSAMTFTRGTAVLRTQREPSPTCPKTGQPGESSAGDVSLLGVAKGGAPFSGSLAVDVTLKTTFGQDPNGNCSLAGTQIELPSLMANLSCRNGRCKGPVLPIACLEKLCANTPVTTEFVSLVVHDDAGQDLARPGVTIVPAKTDAP
jgi:hypothetical protein